MIVFFRYELETKEIINPSLDDAMNYPDSDFITIQATYREVDLEETVDNHFAFRRDEVLKQIGIGFTNKLSERKVEEVRKNGSVEKSILFEEYWMKEQCEKS